MFWQAVKAKISASAAKAKLNLRVVFRDILTSLQSMAHRRERQGPIYKRSLPQSQEKRPVERGGGSARPDDEPQGRAGEAELPAKGFEEIFFVGRRQRAPGPQAPEERRGADAH